MKPLGYRPKLGDVPAYEEPKAPLSNLHRMAGDSQWGYSRNGTRSNVSLGKRLNRQVQIRLTSLSS